MAPDLLSTIASEIDARLRELRPLLAEYERLLIAADALVANDREVPPSAAKKGVSAKRARRRSRVAYGRRGSAAGATKLAATGPAGTASGGRSDNGSEQRLDARDARPKTPVTQSGARSKAGKPRPERAARGAAREAILAALDHGSHTVSELVVVTAMTGPNVNGNLRRLVSEGAVVKTEREGKAAWALADGSAEAA